MDDLNLIKVREYEEIADEYYDATLHPTCANFGALSFLYLQKLLLSTTKYFDRCLEIGAGRSMLADLRKSGLDKFGSISISDKSSKMLRHSNDLRQFYDCELLFDIEDLNQVRRTCSGPYDLIIASLADPYNGSALWRSLEEIIDVTGRVILTTPSYEWAKSFRQEDQSGQYDVAEFVTSKGIAVHVRSIIFRPEEQIALCRRFGFQIDQLAQVGSESIPGVELSPKLNIVHQNRLPAVTGYVFTRR